VRIFLDANILFSAGKSDGYVRRMLELLVAEGHTLCADGYVAEEARRNLAMKDPRGLPTLASLLARAQVSSTQIMPVVTAASLPDKDRPVLAAAIHLKCDVLVTGDRTHFGRFYGRVLNGVAIQSPRTLAESLL
jgi:predicted nucleic acid-binding protein